MVWTVFTALGEILQCETAGARYSHTEYAHFRVVGLFCFGLALLWSLRLNTNLGQECIGVQLAIWHHPRGDWSMLCDANWSGGDVELHTSDRNERADVGAAKKALVSATEKINSCSFIFLFSLCSTNLETILNQFLKNHFFTVQYICCAGGPFKLSLLSLLVSKSTFKYGSAIISGPKLSHKYVEKTIKMKKELLHISERKENKTKQQSPNGLPFPRPVVCCRCSLIVMCLWP